MKDDIFFSKMELDYIMNGKVDFWELPEAHLKALIEDGRKILSHRHTIKMLQSRLEEIQHTNN